jgi:hypothetical protein
VLYRSITRRSSSHLIRTRITPLITVGLAQLTHTTYTLLLQQAKERLHRAARESEARRLARIQAGGPPPTGKGQGQRKGGPQMGNPNMQLMRGPNGEVMMPPGMMQVCVRICYRCITGLCDGSEHYTIVSERTSWCGGCAFVCTGM